MTPGKLIFPVPSNETPPIFLAVASAVAVAALPEVSCVPEVLTPGKLIFAVPSNETPPMVLALSSAVAVSAFPVIVPDNFCPERVKPCDVNNAVGSVVASSKSNLSVVFAPVPSVPSNTIKSPALLDVLSVPFNVAPESNSIVPVLSCRDAFRSAVGSSTLNVVSCASAFAPSKTNASVTLTTG